jgi:hypothetical protein
MRMSGAGRVKQSVPRNVIIFDIGPPKNRNGWAVLRRPFSHMRTLHQTYGIDNARRVNHGCTKGEFRRLRK